MTQENNIPNMYFHPTIELGKIEDAGILVRSGRVDKHWGKQLQPMVWTSEKSVRSLEPYTTDSNYFIDHFNLKSVEYGNWMNQQDRANYLYNTAVSFDDLAKILGISVEEIGLQKNLSIAFGARGSTPALAHYERLSSAIINLTKFNGNKGSLAHEFGHALDNLIGLAVFGDSRMVSGGRTTRKNVDESILVNGSTFEKWFEKFFQALYYDQDGTETVFYHTMIAAQSDYLESRVEIWARYFEQYVAYKGKLRGITNIFLTKNWKVYEGSKFPGEKEFLAALPIAEKIISIGLKLLLNKSNKITSYGLNPEVLPSHQRAQLEVNKKSITNTDFVKPIINNSVLYQAISTEKGPSNGKLLGSSKINKIINGQLTTIYLSKEDFIERIKLNNWESFEVVEKEINDKPTFRKLYVNILKTHPDFQNRTEEYSKRSFDNIVNAGKNGTFNWVEMDAITVWNDQGSYYIISGHSRTAAFKQLLKEGFSEFRNIPAKIFYGSFSEAKEKALNSNTLSSKETDTERANYYRELRKSGKKEKKIFQTVKSNEGANANRIYNFSFLNPTGKAFIGLKAFETADETSKNNIQNIANWLGNVRKSYPQLTHAHENELFDWLINGGFGTKAGQVSNMKQFNDLVYKLIQKNTVFGEFETDKPLNVNRSIYLSPIEAEHAAKKAAAKKEMDQASQERDAKRRELIQRGASEIQFASILKPFDDKVYITTKRYKDLLLKDAEVLASSKDQVTLFGVTLGAVEILSQSSVVNYNGFKPTYIQLSDYSHLISPADQKDMHIVMGGLYETIDLIKQTINEYYNQVEGLAYHLKGNTDAQTAFNIWHFIKENITYDFDTPGIEEIRTPARTWSDRDHRADCEDMAIFAGAILKNLNIPFSLTIVAFNHSPNYQHIYLTAGRKKQYIIDGVMSKYGVHPDNITKTMNMNIQRLSGTGQNVINGLGAVAVEDPITTQMKSSQTEIVREIKSGVSPDRKEYLLKELRKVRYIILLNGTKERDEILPLMAQIEDIRANGEFVFKADTDFENVAKYFNLLNEGGINGVQGFHGFFSKIGKSVKNVVDKAKDVVEKVVDKVEETAKDVADKTKEISKDVWEGIKKYNPASIAARNAFLLLLKLNIFKYASKLGYGYVSENDAKARGYNLSKWKDAVNKRLQLEDTWEKIGGSKSSLRSNVKIGAKKSNVHFSGLGEPITVTVAAAASVIAVLKQFLDAIDPKAIDPNATDEELSPEEQSAMDKIFNAGKNAISVVGDWFSPSDTNVPQEAGYNSLEEQQEIERLLKNGKGSSNDSTSDLGFLKWLIPTSLLAAVGIVMATRPKNQTRKK